MSTKQHGYADGRAFPIFIDRELDDFGLDPYQFRIYARIARRAGERGAYESIKNMATGCQMSEGKVKSSLKVLIDCGLVTKESCLGGTSIYRLTDKSEWLKSSKDLRSKRGYGTTQDVTCLPPGCNVSTPPGCNVSTPPGRNVSTPQDVTCLQRYSIEDTPVEGTPVKEEDPPIVPQSFSKTRSGEELPQVVVEELPKEKEIQVYATSDEAVQSEITLDQRVHSSSSIIPARENHSLSQNTKPNGSEQFPWEQVDHIKGWVIEEGFLKYIALAVKGYSQFKDLPLRRFMREVVNYANKAHFDGERRCKLLGYWQDYSDDSAQTSHNVELTASQVVEQAERQTDREQMRQALRKPFKLGDS